MWLLALRVLIRHNQQGAGFIAIPEPVLKNINLDRYAVTGDVVRYPAQRLLSFYPEHSFHYGATVFVDVQHADSRRSTLPK